MPYELEDMLTRRREVTFDFYGREMHAEYWVERMTKEFRMELLRLLRASLKMQQRAKDLGEAVSHVEAPLDSEQAHDEDTAADTALIQFKADDDKVKRQIDVALIQVLADWDLLRGGKPLPFTPDDMWLVPAEFEGKVVAAILEDARGMGETKGTPNSNPSLIISSRRERRATSRSRRIG